MIFNLFFVYFLFVSDKRSVIKVMRVITNFEYLLVFVLVIWSTATRQSDSINDFDENARQHSQSVVLGHRVDVEALLRDGTLVGLCAAHVERHTMREDSDLLETKRFVAPGTLSLVPDHEIGTLQLSLLNLGVEGFEAGQVGCNHCILFLGHLRVEERGQEVD